MGNPMTKEERSVVINKFRRSKNEYEYKISLYIYWLIIYNDRRDKCADNDERAGAGDRHAASVAGDQRGLAVQAREPGGRRGDLPAQNRKDGQVRRLRHRAQPHRRSPVRSPDAANPGSLSERTLANSRRFARSRSIYPPRILTHPKQAH